MEIMEYSIDMVKQNLCAQVWYDPDENGYIGLDLTDVIPQQHLLTVNGVELLPKAEYHCSLVAARQYTDGLASEQSIADEVKLYLETNKLVFAGLGDDRYVCRKGDRTTIIAPVIIEGIEDFRDFIRTIIPDYKPPFSHVTLLKSEVTEFCIGINSMSDLDLYCTKLV